MSSGHEISPSQLTRITELAGAPCTSGRWRRFGTDPFRPEQIAQVADMGFEVES